MKRLFTVLLTLLLLLGCMPVCAWAAEPAAEDADDALSMDYYADKRIGILAGSIHETLAAGKFPNAELYFYNAYSDMVAALNAHQIDAFYASQGNAISITESLPELMYLDEPLAAMPCAIAFAKTEDGKALCEQFDGFLAGMRADGSLDALVAEWMSPTLTPKSVDYSDLPTDGRVLEFATTGASVPYSMLVNGEPAGLDVELAVRFCRAYGYGIHINLMDWAAVIPGLTSGLYDFAGDCFFVSEERKGSVNFSDTCYEPTVLLVIEKPAGLLQEDSLSLDTYAEKRIGVVSGSVDEQIAERHFPNAEIYYFINDSDCCAALTAGQIDAFVSCDGTSRAFLQSIPTLTRISEPLDSNTQCTLAFSKTENGDALCAQMNDFIAKLRDNGTLDELYEKWMQPEALELTVELPEAENGARVLEFATTGQTPPYSFILNAQSTGLDIELAALFCREYGYGLHINLMDWAAVIPGLASDMYDFAGDCLVISDERRESVNLADPCYTTPFYLIVPKPDADSDDPSELSYYAHKRIGVIGGSIHEDVVAENFPEAQASYYTNNSDMAVALKSGLIDCFTTGIQGAEEICKNVDGLTWLDMPLGTLDIGMAFAKTEDGKALCEQFNDYIAKLRADGSYDKLMANWCGDDAPMVPVDTSDLPTDGRVLEFATTGLTPPYSCVIDGEPNGFDVDLAVHFCREYGYGINISITEVASMMPGLTSGIYDMLGNCLVITPERLESAYMSDATYDTALVLVVNADTLNTADEDAEPETFWQKLALSFEKTFIREQRWRMIVNGLGTTILISVLSVVFGSILGFGICMLRRTGSKTAIGFSVVFTRLLQGTPIVVLLMILFYIIFARTGLNAVAVAVVGFSLNFAAYVCEILRTGIEAVPVGQTEAALASGYTKPQAFFSIVMPQAAINFLPVYRGEIVSLVKSTSVVGYIAIQDLTKAGDLIRSRTYEPFFPLIVTAVIYFTLSWLLGFLLMRMEGKFKPNRKNRTVKGVKLP